MTSTRPRVVDDVIEPAKVEAVRRMIGGRDPIVVPVHAVEASGRNQLPRAYAETLADRLGLIVDDDIVQSSVARRTGSDSVHRLTTRVSFDGPVQAGRDYLLVDDAVTQGGTLADLRAHIEAGGGHVIGATTLIGGRNSHILTSSAGTLDRLRAKRPDLETWWRENVGSSFSIDGLTESEARQLIHDPVFDAVRNRGAAGGREGVVGANEGPAGGTQGDPGCG